MALADATVRAILDVSRFERDLQSKVESAARRAGKSFEREFRKSATPAATSFAADFRTQFSQSMRNVGEQAGRRLASTLSNRATIGARVTGRVIGERLRGGLLSTATQTGNQFGAALRNAAVTPLGGQVGRTFMRGLFDAISRARISGSVARALDDEDSVRVAARTTASRFMSFLGAALRGAAPGRVVLLGGAIAGLVTEGVQFAAAVAPVLQAIGLIPGAMAIAGAAVGTLAVAFNGFGDAVGLALSGDTEKLGEALANLAPAAARVVGEVGQLSPRLRELRVEVQQAFFSSLVGDVTRLGQVLLGPVQRGMSTTAAAAGRMASALVAVVTEARTARIIEEIFGTTARIFDRLLVPVQRMSQGMFDWIFATLPAFERLTDSLGLATDRFADFLQISARSGQALTWVNDSITAFSQLWQVLRNLGGLIGDIFSAANQASGGYLVTLNSALVATRQFLTSFEGRSALVSIFEGLHRVVAALGAPLRELVLQLGGVADIAGDVASALSQGVTSAIRGIGQGLGNAGPSLERFAQSLSDLLSDVAPSLTTLGAAFGRLIDAVSPLAVVVGVIVRAGIGLIDLFSQLPSGILTVVAAFIALRALGVPVLLNNIWTNTTNLVTQMRAGTGVIGQMTAAYQTQLAQLTQLRTQQQFLNTTMAGGIPTTGVFGNALGTLTSHAGAAGAALGAGGGLMGGLRGLMGLLGGPWGVVLAAASIGITLFAEANAKSAQATREHADYVQALAQSFDRETGAITQNTLETVRNNAEKNGLLQKARDLGVSSSSLISALAGESTAIKSTQDELRQKARSLIENSDAYKRLVSEGRPATETLDALTQAALGNNTEFDRMFQLIGDDVNDAMVGLATEAVGAAGGIGDLAGAVKGAGGDIDSARKQYTEFQKALRDSVQNSTVFGQALQKMADTASTAEERTRALREALRALEGGTQSVTEAQVAQHDSLRDISERIAGINESYAEGADKAKDFGASLYEANGQINTSSKGVSELTKTARDLNDRLADVSAAATDQARRTGDWATATQQIGAAYEQNRARLVELATAMGFGAEEAGRFADEMLRSPKQVAATLSLVGAPQALQQLGEVQLRLNALAPGQPKVIYMKALTDEAKKALEGLGFQIETLASGEFKVTPKTDEALAAIQGLKISIDQTTGTMKIEADNEAAKSKIGELGKLLTASAKTKIEVDGKTAYTTVDGLMVYIDGQTGQIKLGALPQGAIDETQALKDWINQQTGKVKVDADTSPAEGSFGGMMEYINYTTSTGPVVQGDFRGAYAGVNALVGTINTSSAAVPVGANTGSAFGSVNGLVDWIRTVGANVGVGAAVSGAIAAVDALVRYINSRTATITVRSNAEGGVMAAEGGMMRYFRHGGFNGMRPMPASRAQIVPPGMMRVIGDRPTGDEAFIPLVNTARSHAIFQAAARRMNYDVTPRNTSSRAASTYTTTVEAGAVVVNAPYSDPRLVARAVVNELTREAVI